ncbi:MAG TPA: LamG-like jellyroll fold domain-containing protein, partial [Verrucomicrobiae bacterium]
GSTAGSLYANVVDTSGNSHTVGPSSGSVPSSQWSHVALTYFKLTGVATLYLDGNSIAQSTIGTFTPQTTYPFVMGARPGTGYKFEGDIDELAIYASALSSGEIANIAAGFKTPLIAWNVTNWEDVGGWWATLTWDEQTPVDDPFVDWKALNILDSYDAASSPGMNGNAVSLSSPLVQPSWAGVSVARNGGLDGPLSTFTFECWLKPEDLNQLEQTIIEWNTGNVNDPVWGIGVHFILSTTAWSGSVGGYGSLYANLIDTSGNSHQVITGPNLVAAHSFNHVALSWDDDTARIYLNGEKVAEGDFGSLNLRNDCAFYLGTRPDWAWAYGSEWGYYLPGLFDEVTLWLRALSDQEVRSIYAAGIAGKHPD